MATHTEYGLIAAGIAVILIAAVGLTGTHLGKSPTVEERYVALKFDQATFQPTVGIVCESADSYKYGDDNHLNVEVQMNDKCEPFLNQTVVTYDEMKVGTHVVLKMDTSGTWWARPKGAKF